MVQELTVITLVSCLFSISSIVLSSYEHLSSSRLLRTTRVLVLKIGMKSSELSRLRRYRFRKIENLRYPIVSKFSTMINIDPTMIELMTPTQTKIGIYFIFRITFNAHMREQVSNIGVMLRAYAENGQLAAV